MSIKGKAYLAGVYEHPTRDAPDKTTAQLHAESARGALADAGLSFDDVDGYFCAGDAPGFGAMSMVDYMGLKNVRHMDTTETGGSSYIVHLHHAAQAIAAGKCSVALITLAGRPRQGGGRPGGGGGGRPPVGLTDGAPEQGFESIYGGSTHNTYGMCAMRHMHEYGTTSEQLAWIKVAASHHAQWNEHAFLKSVVTVEDVLNSRVIADPLHLLDCCLTSDGGAAVIVTSAERARDLRQPPVHVMGMGRANHSRGWTWGNHMTSLAARESGAKAFAMAGITPADVDTAQLYDSYTYIVMATLEDYGFCAKGEGGRFVEGGRLELGGALPTNTSGGMLSEGYLEGMLQINEAVRQLRGQATGRQVKDAEIAVVSGNGGNTVCHSTLLLRR